MTNPSLEQSFWSQLTDEERAGLQATARRRIFSTGTPLMYQGDPGGFVIIVVRGWVKISASSEEGVEVLLRLRGPGDLVGEVAVLNETTRSATVTALSPVDALVVSASRFIAFLDEHPRSWRVVHRITVGKLESANQRMQAHASASGSQRLARLLVELAETYGSPQSDGVVDIRVPLTQQDLGSMVDSSRETVVRALHLWRKDGLIRTGFRKITILDLQKLRLHYVKDVQLRDGEAQ